MKSVKDNEWNLGPPATRPRDQEVEQKWARQQELELPRHVRDLLPKDREFMRKAALEKVPKGKGPAEYCFNLLYFLSLSEIEQVELGATVFEWEKAVGSYDFAPLKMELHDFLFHFPDDDVRMTANHPSHFPKLSTDPRSEWVRLKKLALNHFPVYTRVTLRREPSRGFGSINLGMYRRASRFVWYLETEEILFWILYDDRYGRRKGSKLYKIKGTYEDNTGVFKLLNNNIYNWEIAH